MKRANWYIGTTIRIYHSYFFFLNLSLNKNKQISIIDQTFYFLKLRNIVLYVLYQFVCILVSVTNFYLKKIFQ
jgi:hypothetical protein